MLSPAKKLLVAFASVLPALAASGQIVEIPIDMSMSDLEVTLTLSGVSDTDTSPVIGSVVIELDDAANPTSFTIIDLDLTATETIDHSLSFSIFGSLTQSTSDVAVAYATPGTPSAPASVGAGGMYTLASLDTLLSGMGTYNATGTVCALLEGNSLPCADTIVVDGGGGMLTAQDLVGTLDVSDGTVTWSMAIEVTAPLNADNPGLGTVSVSGIAVGSAPAPDPVCPGDCDETGSVDFADLVAMLFQFGGSDSNGCDADGSGAVNFADLVSALFLFGDCP